MKIYTKRGDAGETGLYGGARVAKDDLRIRTYGTVDELNAVLGVALAECDAGNPIFSMILRVQSELFQLGAELATPQGKKQTMTLIGENEVNLLEKEIDQMEAELSPLKSFILPGGCKLAAALHLARTVCRRAERELVTLDRQEHQRGLLIQYMNRLSDALFVCARFANHLRQVQDTPWIAPRSDR